MDNTNTQGTGSIFCINRHKQDGTQLRSIKVGINPIHIAATSQGTIVVSDCIKPPQIVSNTGKVMYTLQHPVDDIHWSIRGFGICEEIILVANSLPSHILCYSTPDKYLGALTIQDITEPDGIAIAANGNTLLVSEHESIRVYSQ